MRMHRIQLLVPAFALAMLAFAGCSNTSGGDPSKPCPPGGLGVADIAGGDTIADQLNNWAQYNCQKPQICPDRGWVSVVGYPVNPGNPPSSMSVGISNCSTGQQTLVIEKVVVVGDARCYMTEPEIEDKSIVPGATGTKSIRVQWKPKAVGRDDAALLIYSNAENKNPLEVPICGTGVSPRQDAGVAPPPDGGAPPADSGSGTFQCKPVTKVNKKCHSE